MARPAADALALSMIQPERAGSVRHTAMNACASSVSLNWCGDASVTRVTAWPEKSYYAAPALASPFAIPATKHPILQSHPIGPFTPCVCQGVIGPHLDASYPMMTAMRQLGRPLGKLLKGEMSKTRFTLSHGGLLEEELRPTRPPGRSGPLDRTAGGIGGAAPASLDLYGQSRTQSIFDFFPWLEVMYK